MVPFQYTTYDIPREYEQEIHIATAREENGPRAMQQLVDEQVRQPQQNQNQVAELKSELEESGTLLSDEQDAIQVSVWQQGAASNSFVQGVESLAYMSYPQHQNQHQQQQQQQQQHEHELAASAQNEYQQQYTSLSVQEPSSGQHLAQYQLNQHSPHLLQVHGRHHQHQQQQQLNHHQLQHHQMPQTLAVYGPASGHGDPLGHNYSSSTSSAAALYNSYAVANEGKIGLHHHRTNYSHSNHQQHLLVEQPTCYLQLEQQQQQQQQQQHLHQQHDLQQHQLTHQEASSKSAYQVNIWGQQQQLVSPLIQTQSPKDSLNSQQQQLSAADHSAKTQVQSTLGEISTSQVNQQTHSQQQSQAYLSLLSASSSSSTNLLSSTATDSSPSSSSGSVSSSSSQASSTTAKSGLLLDFYSNSVEENFKLTSLCANGKEQRNYQLQAGAHRALGGTGSQQQQLAQSPTTKSCKHISKEAQQNKRSNLKKKTTQVNANELSKRIRTTTDAQSSGGCAGVTTKSASYRKRLRDIDECATYKDADIEHTSTHIIVNNLTPDGKHIGEPVELTNQDLIELTVRQLNKIVQGFPKATIGKLKARRRTLKNRGYAQNCRHKRLNQKHMLEAQNNQLHEELHEEKRKNEEYRRIIEDLKLEIMSLKNPLVQRIHHQQQQQ